jgi:N-acetylmuramoyl-L-alanine amidase
MRKINYIVIHCSATRANQSYTVAQMTKDHKARGFNSAGYNYYIRRDGTVIQLRPIEVIPAQVAGHNSDAIGICYEGGMSIKGGMEDNRTAAQKSAIIAKIKELKKIPEISKSKVLGHRDLSPDLNKDGKITSNEWIKWCPSFDAKTEYKDL